MKMKNVFVSQNAFFFEAIEDLCKSDDTTMYYPYSYSQGAKIFVECRNKFAPRLINDCGFAIGYADDPVVKNLMVLTDVEGENNFFNVIRSAQDLFLIFENSGNYDIYFYPTIFADINCHIEGYENGLFDDFNSVQNKIPYFMLKFPQDEEIIGYVLRFIDKFRENFSKKIKKVTLHFLLAESGYEVEFVLKSLKNIEAVSNYIVQTLSRIRERLDVFWFSCLRTIYSHKEKVPVILFRENEIKFFEFNNTNSYNGLFDYLRKEVIGFSTLKEFLQSDSCKMSLLVQPVPNYPWISFSNDEKYDRIVRDKCEDLFKKEFFVQRMKALFGIESIPVLSENFIDMSIYHNLLYGELKEAVQFALGDLVDVE